ncbi:MAG TPA: hypothetical protein VIW29_03135 [Polyangiaceae bacterium]
MGDQSRSSRSSGLPLLLRLLSVVAALAVLCVSGRASAAPARAADATQPVPMCGDHNESIAAPPIFRAYEPGTLIASPCKSASELQLGSSLPLAPERVVIHERPERVLGCAGLALAQSASSRLAVDAAHKQAPRPGFIVSLFRPPQG